MKELNISLEWRTISDMRMRSQPKTDFVHVHTVTPYTLCTPRKESQFSCSVDQFHCKQIICNHSIWEKIVISSLRNKMIGINR